MGSHCRSREFGGADFCASSSEFTAVAVPPASVSPLVLAGVADGRTHLARQPKSEMIQAVSSNAAL